MTAIIIQPLFKAIELYLPELQSETSKTYVIQKIDDVLRFYQGAIFAAQYERNEGALRTLVIIYPLSYKKAPQMLITLLDQLCEQRYLFAYRKKYAYETKLDARKVISYRCKKQTKFERVSIMLCG